VEGWATQAGGRRVDRIGGEVGVRAATFNE